MMAEMLFIACLLLGLKVVIKESPRHKRFFPKVSSDSLRGKSDTSSDGSTGSQQAALSNPLVFYDTTVVQSMRERYREARLRRSIVWGSRLSGFERGARVDPAVYVENWRKSIVGLMSLARRNLLSATAFYMQGDCRGSILASSTGVENISRALIHCYGGKPDPSTGQEEALRLLSKRFDTDERVMFEKAVENVECLSSVVARLRTMSTNVVTGQPFEQENGKQVLELATNTVYVFRKIIREKFADEIPELR